jgi:hypothetical protein
MARTARRAGRPVVIANSRGPETLTSVVAALGDGVSAGTVGDAAAARIVVVAVPWASVPDALEGLQWDSQVVIDATNDWAADDLDGRDLRRCQRVQGDPTGSEVLERADGAQPGATATHTIIGNAEQAARPGVRSVASDGRSPPPPIWTSTSGTQRVTWFESSHALARTQS